MPMVSIEAVGATIYHGNMDMRIRNVDPQLRYEFKLLCAKLDISMNKMLQKLMREAIEKDKKRGMNE